MANEKVKMPFYAVVCGHGISTDGSWDPGTVYDVNNDGKISTNETEAKLMLDITKPAVKYLRDVGCKVWTDADKDNNLNMIKCIAKANSLGVDAYISLHCDWYKAQSGTLPLYWPTSKSGKKLADCINKRVMKEMKLKTRGLSARSDLGELADTDMAACIFETGSIKADIKTLRDAEAYGEAVAKGILDYSGIKTIKTKGALIVRESASLESKQIKVLKKGKPYVIVDTDEKGTRGKLKDGGWITITSKFVE